MMKKKRSLNNMSNTSNTAATSTIITGRRTRLSYAQLFEPKG